MSIMSKQIITAAVAAVLSSSSAFAATVTQWNFNSNPPDATSTPATGTTSPSVGAGTIGTVGGVTTPGFSSGNGSSDAAGTFDNSGYQTEGYPSANDAGNKTAGIEVAVSTVGFEDIMVSFDQRHSNTSANTVRFQYSTDGITFVDSTQFTFTPAASGTGDTWYNNRSIDLSSVAAADNNPNFKFRVVSEFDPGTGTYLASRSTSTYAGGTYRFDMVTVSGTAAVPEPATLGVIALGSLIALRRRRA